MPLSYVYWFIPFNLRTNDTLLGIPQKSKIKRTIICPIYTIIF